MKLKIKKGDEVQVIAGSEKGRKGPVLELDSRRLKIRVKGVRVQTRHDKKEGILKREGFIDYSNVKLIQAASAAAKPKKSKQKPAAVPSLVKNTAEKQKSELSSSSESKKRPAAGAPA